MDQTAADLEERLKQAATLRESIDLGNALAWHLHKSDPPRAYSLAQEAITLSNSGEPADDPYRPGVATGLYVQGQIHYYQSEYDQSIAKCLESIALLEHEAEGNALPETTPAVAAAATAFETAAQILANAYNTLAGCYRNLGNLSESLTHYFKQLEISESSQDKKSYATALVGVGSIYYDMKDNQNALAYFERSLEAFRQTDDGYWTALVLNNVSYMRFKMGDPQGALPYAHEGLRIAQEGGHDRMVTAVSMTLGETYNALDDLENSMTHLQNGIRLAHSRQYVDNELDGMRLIGQALLQRGQPQEAIPYLDDALALAEKINHRRFIYQCCQALAQAYKEIGDFEKALTYYERFFAVRESVFNEESGQKLQNLEVLHRTQNVQKEADYYASLYQAEQQRRHLSEVMNQVGRALTSTLNLNEVLDQVLARLHELVPYDRGALLLLRRGVELEFVAGYGYEAWDGALQMKIPIDTANQEDIFNRIYQTGQSLTVNDAASYPYWKTISELPPPASWLGVPLISNEVVIGMLSLARHEMIPYEEEAIQLATMFADQAAIALENARLYNQVKRFTEQLEDEVSRRTQALLDAYQQLERLDRTKSDFIAITAHELRTPITVLKGYGQVLAVDALVKESQYHQGLVSGIVAGANRLHEIVNTMLMMVKIDSKALEIYVEPFNLYSLLKQLVKELAEDVTERKQTLTLDEALRDLPPVAGDQEALATVFANLLINAIKYTPDGGEIRIHGRSWTTPLPPHTLPRPDLPDAAVQIVISDTGIGIDPEMHELIFTKFYQTGEVALHSSGKTKFKGGGPGLGLAIARGVIEAHQGQIWVESLKHDETSFPGSDFHIVLPLPAK